MAGASNSRHITAELFTGSAKTLSLPPNSWEIALPGALNPADVNRDWVQVKDGTDNWELLHTMQRNQEFTIEFKAEGPLYSGSGGNVFDMIRRDGIYAADSYIDPGEDVWTIGLRFTITRGGVSRVLTFPSLIPEGDLNISPETNTVPVKFTHTGSTDPSWA